MIKRLHDQDEEEDSEDSENSESAVEDEEDGEDEILEQEEGNEDVENTEGNVKVEKGSAASDEDIDDQPRRRYTKKASRGGQKQSSVSERVADVLDDELNGAADAIVESTRSLAAFAKKQTARLVSTDNADAGIVDSDEEEGDDDLIASGRSSGGNKLRRKKSERLTEENADGSDGDANGADNSSVPKNVIF